MRKTLRRTLPVRAVIIFGLLFGPAAHAQVQIFGGYSYLRPNVTVQPFAECPVGALPPCPSLETAHLNLNGWEASASFNPVPVFGFAADFAGDYGAFEGSTVHVQTYLFGPQVRFPGPISPFVHALFGDAHETVGASEAISPSVANAFAMAAGGGLDVKLVPFVSLRVIQIDDLITRFGSATQHQPRASAGLVIHF